MIVSQKEECKMYNLFFGDVSSVLSLVFLLAVAAYIVITITRYKKIEKWGRRVLVLAITGLALCCFVATRDDYVASLQGGTGVFALDSIQVYLAYAGGAVNGFATLSSIFVRNQKYRRLMFFILSGSIIFKAVLIEASRMLML
jgi:hypothetical protein